MTYKEALKLSYDKWVWLFKNPGRHYTEWERYDEIEDMRASCPLCQFFRSACSVCVLYHHNGCGASSTAFYRWANSNSFSQNSLYAQKLAAARIAGILRRELRKEERRGV